MEDFFQSFVAFSEKLEITHLFVSLFSRISTPFLKAPRFTLVSTSLADILSYFEINKDNLSVLQEYLSQHFFLILTLSFASLSFLD